MQVSNKFIRSAGTSLVAVFLVAGAALATGSFVSGGVRLDDGKPVSDLSSESPTATAGSTFETTESAELESESPSASPETETESASDAPDETAEPSDDHDDDHDGDRAGHDAGHDDDDNDKGSDD